MLVTRSYKNNWGYQVDTNRPHPISVWEPQRNNRNHYSYNIENGDVKMAYNRGREQGLQYGGKHKSLNCQLGKGIDPQAVIKALQMLKIAGKVAVKAYTSPAGNLVKNTYGKFMNKNPNWRPGFAGEKHMLTKRGITYNWCGPGTSVSARLQRGDVGISELDEICKVHDLDYTKAKTWGDVRKADKKMISTLSKSNVDKPSKLLVKSLMQAKVLGEDVGIFGKETFVKFPNLQDEIPPKIQESQPPIDLAGQGHFFDNKDPARKLRSKIKKYRRKKQTDKLLGIAFQSIKKRLKQ